MLFIHGLEITTPSLKEYESSAINTQQVAADR